MVTLHVPVVTVRRCHSLYRYFLSRTDRAHRRLAGIEVGFFGCRTIYEFTARADEEWRRLKKPVLGPALHIYGGSTYGASLTSQEAEDWFTGLVESMQIKTAITAAHFSRHHGRFDFHLLIPNCDPQGRPFMRHSHKRRRFVLGHACAMTVRLNTRRLEMGNILTIGNLRADGTLYFQKDASRDPATEPENTPPPIPTGRGEEPPLAEKVPEDSVVSTEAIAKENAAVVLPEKLAAAPALGSGRSGAGMPVPESVSEPSATKPVVPELPVAQAGRSAPPVSHGLKTPHPEGKSAEVPLVSAEAPSAEKVVVQPAKPAVAVLPARKPPVNTEFCPERSGGNAHAAAGAARPNETKPDVAKLPAAQVGSPPPDLSLRYSIAEEVKKKRKRMEELMAESLAAQLRKPAAPGSLPLADHSEEQSDEETDDGRLPRETKEETALIKKLPNQLEQLTSLLFRLKKDPENESIMKEVTTFCWRLLQEHRRSLPPTLEGYFLERNYLGLLPLVMQLAAGCPAGVAAEFMAVTKAVLSEKGPEPAPGLTPESY